MQNDLMPLINSLGVPNNTIVVSKTKTANTNSIASPNLSIISNKASEAAIEFKDIKTFDDVQKALKEGLIESISIVDLNDYSENKYNHASYEITITAKNEKNFLPWQKVQKKIYIGNQSDFEIRALEHLSARYGIKPIRQQFNASAKATQDVATKILVSAAPVILGLGCAAAYKQYNIHKLKASLSGFQRENFGKIQNNVIGENVRKRLFGYSEEVYRYLEGVHDFCLEFNSTDNKKRGMDIGGSAFFTGPPGTGKTHIADLTANHIQKEALKAGKKVCSLDLTSIITEYSSPGNQIASALKAQINAENVAQEILKHAEEQGAQIIVIRSDDAGVGGERLKTELAANFTAELAKQMRGMLTSAQNEGTSVSQNKGILGFFKSLFGGKQTKKSTSIESIAFQVSTNSTGIENLKSDTKNYSGQALLDRLGSVITVGSMEIDTRYDFINHHLPQVLGVNSLPPNFAKLLCVLTASHGDEEGASIRDYMEAGHLFNTLKRKFGNEPLLQMQKIGNAMENWVNNNGSPESIIGTTQFRPIIEYILSPLAAKNKAIFNRFEELLNSQTLFKKIWNQITPSTF